jgi:hypothetical protein
MHLGIGAAFIVAAFTAGGVVAGQFGGLADPEELATDIRGGTVVRVADVDAAAGLPGRGVFVQTTPNGLLCVFEAPSATSLDRRGGCNSVDDPLGGSKLSASLSYDGGPGVADVADARLVGLAARDVASIQVLMSDGTRRTIAMRRALAVANAAGGFRAFGYRFPTADFKRGIGPTTVLALDASGREVARQATGYGG